MESNKIDGELSSELSSKHDNQVQLIEQFNIAQGFMPTKNGLLYIVELVKINKKAAFEIMLMEDVSYHFNEEKTEESFLLSKKWDKKAFVKDCFIQEIKKETFSNILAFKPHKHIITGLARLPPFENIVHTILNEK
jgi:hypothetical protein